MKVTGLCSIMLTVTCLLLFESICFGQQGNSNWTFGRWQRSGTLGSPKITESSGLAASRSNPGYYWTHNDNGKNPGLFLIDGKGNLVATWQLPGVEYRDWEAISGATFNQVNYLVLADVGDNGGRYPSARLYLFKEPEPDLVSGQEKPAAGKIDPNDLVTIQFRYPDGPHDCEAMAVDVAHQSILLISKRRNTDQPATMVHVIPWHAESTKKPLMAVKTDAELPYDLVTGFDVSPDGKLAVIRNYSAAWFYRRESQEKPWHKVLAQQNERGKRVLLPLQRQGEAICFSRDGRSVLVTSEGSARPLWKMDLQHSQAP